ncbi:hypothetical protein CEP54_004871 [Fusarium duplospermum]|uniref:Uncharacterized protein n=1 Tax=Fusarium duplospermum TaxID=1325734 RepID=A0A428QFR7_9HYPO|nr:hypothetical protein CEP54_004871 [Fusarium duplospermum]
MLRSRVSISKCGPVKYRCVPRLARAGPSQSVHVPQRGYLTKGRYGHLPTHIQRQQPNKQHDCIHPKHATPEKHPLRKATYLQTNISLLPIYDITYRLIKTLAPLSCALRSLQPSHPI